MLLKGSKIKLVKALPGFDKIGDVFDVVDISDQGIITIISSYGRGIMSYNEFQEYFEEVKELKFGEWEDYNTGLFNYKYRTNGKVIELTDNNYEHKVKSTCLDEDIFNLDKGLELCLAKLSVKKSGIFCKKIKEKHQQKIDRLNELLKEM